MNFTDLICHVLFPALLSDHCYRDHCYILGGRNVFSQSEAEVECQQEGAHLVTIESEDENEFLLRVMHQTGKQNLQVNSRSACQFGCKGEKAAQRLLLKLRICSLSNPRGEIEFILALRAALLWASKLPY